MIPDPRGLRTIWVHIAAGIVLHSSLLSRDEKGTYHGAKGNGRREAFDIYSHIDMKELK